MRLSDMPVKTAAEIVLSITMLTWKVSDSDIAMIESDVEFQVDLIVERCAATNIFAGEQTMMNFWNKSLDDDDGDADEYLKTKFRWW